MDNIVAKNIFFQSQAYLDYKSRTKSKKSKKDSRCNGSPSLSQYDREPRNMSRMLQDSKNHPTERDSLKLKNPGEYVISQHSTLERNHMNSQQSVQEPTDISFFGFTSFDQQRQHTKDGSLDVPATAKESDNTREFKDHLKSKERSPSDETRKLE